MSKITTLIFLFLFSDLYAATSYSINPDRRRDQFQTDFGYFLYPIFANIPGSGSSKGVGGTVVNMFGTDTDLTSFYLRGEFDATGIVLLNQHILPKFLIFDLGYYDYRVATQLYERGINSGKDSYVLPEIEGAALVSQLTFSFFERKVEAYGRLSGTNYRVLNVQDAQGNEFENVNTGQEQFMRGAVGLKFDLTDDKLDPRNGLRFELEATHVLTKLEDVSEYYTLETNTTSYFPVSDISTFAINLFTSKAFVSKQASVDPNYLKQQIGLNCDQSDNVSECLSAEDKVISERIALNTYGQGSSLGGTQRLRSFPNGRFAAGSALFLAGELRYNLTEEHTFMNFYFLRGYRNNIQLAAFAEVGTVSENFYDSFSSDFKHSYGVGARMIFSGVTLRLDFARGNEGSEVQMFLDYSWNLYSIENGV